MAHRAAALLAIFLLGAVLLNRAPAFAQSSPQDETATAERARMLAERLQACIDSLHESGLEEVFTLGRGGNAPDDPIAKMNRVLDGSFRNPEAHRISDDIREWGRRLRHEFRDLGEPLITRIEIVKSLHTALIWHGETLLFETPVAVGNPAIGKATPTGNYHVLYVDYKPISRWIRGNVPYGHEYNPYGSRQIPFYQDWTMHGNNDDSALGQDISKGCVRFHNSEVLVIAELVTTATRVDVKP